MFNTVTRLKPRVANFEVATQAFLEGDFSYCAEALSDNGSTLACFLKSRALMRLGDFLGALEAIEHVTASALSHEYAAELLVLRAYSLMFLGDSQTELILTEARARGFSSGLVALECEVEYAVASAAWIAGRLEEALDATSRLLELGDCRPGFSGSQRCDYLYTSGYWRSRAYDLRGVIYASREDYEAQAASLANGFVEFDRGLVRDTFVESRMLLNLAVLVRDIDSEVLASFVEARAEQLEWRPAAANEEFGVYQAIGWNRAKRGDHLGAFRQLRRSASAAPTVARRISAMLDKSFLARELGEVMTAQDELDHATKLAKQVDWESTPGNDRSTLFELARQIAPADPKTGRALWNRYASLKTKLSALELAARGDRRQRADECSALATVLNAEGNRSRAISLFLESFEIYSEVGYCWRAAAIAAELAELTREARYLDYAAREAAKQPNSWLARRVASLKVCATD